MQYNGRMDKQSALRVLAAEMEQDGALPLASQANFVFGEGNPDCAVLFIGEAPGYNEDVERRPFVGRAGQLLRRMIRDIGWREEDVYITNIVKRRPPENRDPLPAEIAAYEPYLTRQIGIIAPKAVATLGRFSMSYFLPLAKISRDHGKVFRTDGRILVPLYHPAAALRAPDVLTAFEADFRKLPEILAGGGTADVEFPASRPEANPPAKPPVRQTKLF